MNQAEGTSLSLIEVAAAAGVSRATIYKSVGSRPALLAAVFEDQGRLIQFDRMLAAAQVDDPVQAILATVRESCPRMAGDARGDTQDAGARRTRRGGSGTG